MVNLNTGDVVRVVLEGKVSSVLNAYSGGFEIGNNYIEQNRDHVTSVEIVKAYQEPLKVGDVVKGQDPRLDPKELADYTAVVLMNGLNHGALRTTFNRQWIGTNGDILDNTTMPGVSRLYPGFSYKVVYIPPVK